MVNARPVMRKRWSSGLIPRHCPAIPNRSSASLSEVASSFAARRRLASSGMLHRFGVAALAIAILQHLFVVGAHDLADRLAFADGLGHGFFAGHDLFGGLDDSFHLGGGDEDDSARVGDRV